MDDVPWALDDRPTQPCVVCHGVPDRTVDLPELPDVHIAFGSSAQCRDCAAAAADNDAAELTRRAQGGWADDEAEVVSDLVRLVLAAAGHRPAPKPLPPAEFREPSPQPLSAGDAAIWAELEPLMYDGPDREIAVHGGIVHEYDGRQTVTLVDLAGSRARLADAGGRPWLITDGDTMWRRSRPDDADVDAEADDDEGELEGEYGDDAGDDHVEGVMTATPYRGPEWAGDGSELAGRRSRREVADFGFGQPIGPLERTEYLGRAAWRFAFAAPPHKPNDMKVVVDAETGLVLEERFGALSIARWTELLVGGRVDDTLFRWDGPVITYDDLQARQQRRHEADLARRAAWFAANVTAEPLSVAGQAVTVLVHAWAPDGGFEASLGDGLDGSVARRPRSTDWWPLGWSSVTHRWTDDRWDWALSHWDPHDEPITTQALAELKRTLGRSPA